MVVNNISKYLRKVVCIYYDFKSPPTVNKFFFFQKLSKSFVFRISAFHTKKVVCRKEEKKQAFEKKVLSTKHFFKPKTLEKGSENKTACTFLIWFQRVVTFLAKVACGSKRKKACFEKTKIPVVFQEKKRTFGKSNHRIRETKWKKKKKEFVEWVSKRESKTLSFVVFI